MRSFGRARPAGIGAGLKAGLYAAVIVLALFSAAPRAQSTQAAELYQQAHAREADLRKKMDATPPSSAQSTELLERMRTLVRTYEDLWRLFPTSGYSDNALWQGAMLSTDAFSQSGDAADRGTSLRLFHALTANFPTSSLIKQVPAQVSRLEAARVVEPAARTATSLAAPVVTAPASPATPPRNTPATPSYATLTAIRREVLPDVLRVTLELGREPVFSSERIDGPPRVFVDLQNTRASEALKDATLPFSEDVVRQVRVGRQLNGRTRVVLDLSGAGKYSVYALYNPFRIVIDFERTVAPVPPATLLATSKPAKPVDPGATWVATSPASQPAPTASSIGSKPAAAAPPTPETASPSAAAGTPGNIAAPPAPPAANSTGSFSLSRQLGLGVARIVIDPGHGGHDPGAQVKGLTEADLTLDIALRLEKLLAKQPGVEVILTRRNNSYVQLEERTAIANRTGADLFLSIHANASDNPSLRGIETYFLNLSPNPEAGLIAARENASSSRTMHDFSDIVKAIALNNKIDESRDFASMVQSSMFERLRTSNKELRNLGVKQAPFMVLIGATMPSILAEISFLTNKQEGSLLKTEKYRQQIAEALYQGVMRYQQSLKKAPAVAFDTTRR